MQAPDGSVHIPIEAAEDVIEELFTYHAPTEEQKVAYVTIRNAAKNLVHKIDQLCPGGPDRTTAVRKVREAVMTANASIATNNAIYR